MNIWARMKGREGRLPDSYCRPSGWKERTEAAEISCTMCSDVVMAVQRAASLSPRVTGEMIDLMHYPELKRKYKIMSVPCMVINDTQVYFGRKSLEEVTELLWKA